MAKQTHSIFTRLAGTQAIPVKFSEKLISGLGGLIALLIVFWFTRLTVGHDTSVYMLPSIGATAVLLFGTPHSALAQPWPVIGGHCVSAFIGVTCLLVIPDKLIAASCAAGLAITMMYLLHCMHPPGGATAMLAVIGGPEVEQIGYAFVVSPVLISVLAILVIATIFNFPFSWRRYPSTLAAVKTGQAQPSSQDLSTENLEFALTHLGSFVDISEDDARRLIAMAGQPSEQFIQASDIRTGAYYGHDTPGDFLQIRRVTSIHAPQDSTPPQVVFTAVNGQDRGQSGSLPMMEFVAWTKGELTEGPEEGQWCWILPARHVKI